MKPNRFLFDFSSPAKASLAFSLLNTDFLGFDFSDVPTTSKNALALMITSLEINKNRLPEEAQRNIEILLEKFRYAYEMELLHIKTIHHCNTPEEFRAANSELQNQLIERLKAEKPIYLASGWAGIPAGHHIALELTPFRNKEGVLMVKGLIQNRGAGIEHHETFTTGIKLTYDL